MEWNSHMNRLLLGFRIADLVCSLQGREAYVALARITSMGFHISLGGWAGKSPSEPSRAPFAAGSKLSELFLAEPEGDELLMTPTELEIGLGWQGGVRIRDIVVGVSHWKQEHDKLLALVALYGLQYGLRLHHVGFRFSTEEEMREASERLGNPIEKPADDHLRAYHRIEDTRAPKGFCFIEHQFFPKGPKTPAVHWDFATADSERLLRFFGSAFGLEPIFFEQTFLQEGPDGVVWVKANADDSEIGIMARERWWNPDQD